MQVLMLLYQLLAEEQVYQAGLEIAMFFNTQEEEIKLQLLYTKHTKQYTTRLLTKS